VKTLLETFADVIRHLSRAAFNFLFLPGIPVRIAIYILIGRAQGAQVRCGDVWMPTFLVPYRARGQPIS
jgi:hypothetical protein